MRDHGEKRPAGRSSGPPVRKNGRFRAIPPKELLRRVAWYRARQRALEHEKLNTEKGSSSPAPSPVIVPPVEDESARHAGS